MKMPTLIETERLLLRPVSATYLDEAHAALLASEKELQHFLAWPHPKIEDKESLEKTLDSFSMRFRQGENWAYHLFTKESDALVGSVDVIPIDKQVPSCHIGYWGHSACQGQGYISEAVRAVRDAALQHLSLKRLEIRCDDRNINSARVAERCGFVLESVRKNDARHAWNQVLYSTRVYTYPIA